jgi:multiple sugar transport system substrate-binding protein
VTFEFLAWGDNADIPAWEKLTTAYKAKNANATVTVTPVAEPNANYYPKLQTMIAGGTPPAIASFQGWEWQPYADQDVLAPIDEMVAANAYFKDVYPAGVASIEGTTMRGGKRYLIPLQRAAMLMFYAKKPFEEAGVEFPKDDWTFDQFLATAKKLTNADKKMFGIQANGGWFRDIGWIRGTGKQEFDNLYDPKKATFNQPEIADVVQQIANSWYNTDKIAPTPADLQGGANTINTGNCAMKYEGPWFFGALNSPKLREDKKNVAFDVVLMPKMADEGRPHRGWTEGVALLKGDHMAAAWEFGSFMAGEEGCKIYSETTGRIPNTDALVQNFWLPVIENKFEVKNGAVFLEAFAKSEVDVVGKVPRSKMWSEVVKPVAWDVLMAGKATAADVLPKVDEGVQKLLDEAYK